MLILLALQVVLPVAQEEDITVLPLVTAPSPETEPVPEVPLPVPGTPLLPPQSPFIPPEISPAPRTHSLPSILIPPPTPSPQPVLIPTPAPSAPKNTPVSPTHPIPKRPSHPIILSPAATPLNQVIPPPSQEITCEEMCAMRCPTFPLFYRFSCLKICTISCGFSDASDCTNHCAQTMPPTLVSDNEKMESYINYCYTKCTKH
ncbi:hypothetical protein SLE2022_311150 [Rubroshorea leprosula]